jgi:hypothetical protein
MIAVDQYVSADVLYMVAAAAGATATIMIYLEKKFGSHRKLVYESQRMFLRVMSRHNREDDDRFEAISNGMWHLALRNARKDGDDPPPRITFPRRRYLIETEEEGDDEFGRSSG